MGPIRGYKKKRKIEHVDLASGSSEDVSLDWWDEFSKRISGIKSESKGPDYFKLVFKISRKTFNYISNLVKDHMSAKSTNFYFTDNKAMSVDDQVALAIRRLSSGESLIAVGDTFGTNHSTVSQITWRFVEALEDSGLRSGHLRWPTGEEIPVIKSKFEKICGLPNCLGVIASMRVTMLLPATNRDSDTWRDPDGQHSMIVQTVVGPDGKFLDVVAGWPGKMTEISVLKSSQLFDLCERGERLNGREMKLLEDSLVREYVIGDSRYPLLPWLLTPYGSGQAGPDARFDFDRRHAAARAVAERAIRRLKEEWTMIRGEMWRPDKHKLPRVILACCILHNIVIDIKEDDEDEEEEDKDEDGEFTEVDYDELTNLTLCKSKKNDIELPMDEGMLALRDKLAVYLSGESSP